MTKKQARKEFKRILEYMDKHFPMPEYILYQGCFPGYFYAMN